MRRWDRELSCPRMKRKMSNSSPITKVDPAILNDLAEYDSATVQNAAILVRGYVPAEEDYTGPGLEQLLPLEGGVTVGYALTSVWTPITQPANPPLDQNTLWAMVAEANAPTIVVLKDGDPQPNRGALIGDGMAYLMRALGVVGAIVGGNARDIPGIAKSELGLWATGKVPGHGPFGLVSTGDTVEVAQLNITHGDILVCDQDGVTRVPTEIAADVAKTCAEVRAKEAKIHSVFKSEDFSIEKWRASR